MHKIIFLPSLFHLQGIKESQYWKRTESRAGNGSQKHKIMRFIFLFKNVVEVHANRFIQ